MKSIRWKLFLSVGLILLIVASLNYFLPKYFVTKDLNSASRKLLDKFGEAQKKIQHSITVWISSYFIEQASQLETFAKVVEHAKESSTQDKSLWVLGSELITFNPGLGYLQISDRSGKMAIIAPENAKKYMSMWAKPNEQTLLIRIPEKQDQLFLALPQRPLIYALYPVEIDVDKSISFQEFTNDHPVLTSKESADQLYQYLEWEQNQLMIKAEMIEMLAPFQENQDQNAPVGMLAVDQNLKIGYPLFSDEVFLKTSGLMLTEKDAGPELLVRENGGPFLDLAYTVSSSDLDILLAFSLSRLAQAIANVMQKPLLLSDGKGVTLYFSANVSPERVPPGTFSSSSTFSWEGTCYQPYTFQLGPLYISLLTPIDEVDSIPKLMAHLQETLINKISYNLLFAALFVLAIAILLLARISKRITQPITKLALASEEIGRGKYEEVELPNVKNREDEVAVLTHAFEGMVIALRDREKIRGVLNKVVSKEVASEILKSDVELGGEDRVITLLFSDIRNFTQLSNTMEPKAVVEMLNDYMTQMCEIIDHTHGVVDKFVGDEIMALYGAPLPLEDHADRSIEAAILMMQTLNRWNRDRQTPLSIGIGVHTGSVCSGNMGAVNRLNYTVIGANVNLASRLCSVAKPMQILVSKETKESLKSPEKFVFKELEPVSLKGFEHPLPVFELSYTIDS